jgi:hypothetical protein
MTTTETYGKGTIFRTRQDVIEFLEGIPDHRRVSQDALRDAISYLRDKTLDRNDKQSPITEWV